MSLQHDNKYVFKLTFMISGKTTCKTYICNKFIYSITSITLKGVINFGIYLILKTYQAWKMGLNDKRYCTLPQAD